jgi:tetratricopeptide (TPR) repeat protein
MRRWDAHGKWCGAVVGGLLLVLPLGVGAQGKDTAQAHIDAARRFYEELEYERAMDALDRAQRRARTQDEFSSVLLYEGVILAELGRSEEAAAAFQASLNLQPEATLPLVVSPKIQKQFEAARRDAQQSLARVSSKPPPAPAEDTLKPPVALPVSPPPAPAEAISAPVVAAPVRAVEALPQNSSSMDRNALARRIAGFEARLREPREPAMPAAAAAQLKDLRQQLGEAITAQMRSILSMKLDWWERRYFPPEEPPAPVVEASAPRVVPTPVVSSPVSSTPESPPPSYAQSTDRTALVQRFKECEARLRQKNAADTGPALIQLRDLRQQLAGALTPQLRMNVAVSLDRWERRFLSAP